MCHATIPLAVVTLSIRNVPVTGRKLCSKLRSVMVKSESNAITGRTLSRFSTDPVEKDVIPRSAKESRLMKLLADISSMI